MKKAVLYIFLFSSIVLLADCLMYFYYQISFAGYYSDIVLFWLWLFTSIIVIVLYWRKIMVKLFFIIMVLALIGSIVPMMIPFYAILLSMTPSGLKFDKQLNTKYRAQIVGYSIMTLPRFELIEKKGILEKKLLHCTEMDFQGFKDDRIAVKYESQLRSDLRISEAKDIAFKSETDSTVTLALLYGQPTIIITFDKTTKQLKQRK